MTRLAAVEAFRVTRQPGTSAKLANMQSTTILRCPECDAENAATALRCWLCGNTLKQSVPAEPPPGSLTTPRQFSITSLMLTITMIAVVLGVIRLVPGLGIGLIVLVTPAFVRATVLATREKSAGRRLGPSQKVLAFLASMGLVLSTAMAAGLAFYVTCWGGFLAGAGLSGLAGVRGWDTLSWGLGTGIIVGIAGQIVFTMLFIRWLWRRRHQQRNRLGDVGFILSWAGFATIYSLGILVFMRMVRLDEGVAAFGFLAIPGLIISLIALRKPHRTLASVGVGLGLSACGVSFALFILLFAGLRSWTPDSFFALAVVLLLGLTVAVGVPLLVSRRGH